MRRLVQFETCVLLAVAMWLVPIAAVRAQLPAESDVAGIDTRFVTPETVAIAYLKPARIMKAPIAEWLPTEVATAAGLKHLGIDPADVESIQVVVEPPMGQTLFFAAVAKTTNPVDIDALMAKLPPEISGQYEATKVGGRPFLKGKQEMMPGIYLPTPNTLVVATQPMLKKLFNKRSGEQSGIVLNRLKESAVDDDFYAMVNIETLRPLINMGLAQGAQDVPPPMRQFLDAPDLIRDVELGLNVTGHGPTRLLIHANDAADAAQLVSMVDQAKAIMQAEQNAQIQQMLASSDEVEQAFGKYMQRMQGKMDEVKPQVDGDTLTIFNVDDVAAGNPAVLLAISGVLVALLLPAVQSAREAARRSQSINNMKQLMLGLLNYESVHREYPAHAIYSDDGKPLLSWRVAILPYLEEQQLYDQFHMDEPWDSEHNLALAKQMPAVFLDPSSTLDSSESKTSYLGVAGENGIFPAAKQGTRLAKIIDGTSNTVAIVQVDDDKAVVWTKPDDYTPDENDPLAGLGGLHPGVFIAAFCDGSVQSISNAIDLETWKALMTRNGGEVVDW